MPHIGASGAVGIALEDVSGVYQTPTHFVPINSESLRYASEPVERRPIRMSAGVVGVLPGNASVEGDLEMEALSDIFTIFMHAARCTVVKSGAAPNFTYTFTPDPMAVPDKTLSISVKRGPRVFGYTGCTMGNFTLSIGDDGVLMHTASIFGRDENDEAALIPVWPSTTPFSAGMYNLAIPVGTQIFDADTFEFSVEDNPEAQNRISTTRGAAFVKFGESSASLSIERDFENDTLYEQFKAGTSNAVRLLAQKTVNESIQIDMPVGFMRSYDINLGGQGDLIRGATEYLGAVDAAGKHYQIITKTSVDIT